MAKAGAKGFKELLKKMKRMRESDVTPAAERATATMARIVRDDAKARVYTANGPWTVYYGSKGARTKRTLPAGSVAEALIIKRLPKGELKGMASKHLVTVLSAGDKAPVARAALLMEYGAVNGAFNPFLRPALAAKESEAQQEAAKVLEHELQKAWNRT